MKSTLPLLSVILTLLTSIALLPTSVLGKKDSPTVKTTTLDYALDNVFYFDDSDVVIGIDGETATVYRSDDAGGTWKKVDDVGQGGKSWQIWPHTWDNQRAYILGIDRTHWVTTDQGKSWKSFKSASIPFFSSASALRFHGLDPKKVIFNGESCLGVFCENIAYYTEDDFTTLHVLGLGTNGCNWAIGDPLFATDIASKLDKRVMCVKEGLFTDLKKDNRLLVSDDYFKNDEIEPALDNGRTVPGVIKMAAVKKYIVAAAKSEGTDELALYVTDDSSQWHRAEFGQHKIEEDAYTLLESTNYSMQIDVLGSRSRNPMGYLFTSNSNGTYFTRNIDYTNRDRLGRVDFEKIQNIQGIVLVNVVDNGKEVQASASVKKKIISQISFDDGRTFEDLKVGSEKLHLHSITEAPQDGRIFSSPAPGIVMGNGNTGKYLGDYADSDLYVSDDAGRNWRKALDGTHLYEFGNNGAILAAVKHKKPTKQMQYSLDHGKTWAEAELDQEISVDFLTTVPDSTTRKFLMMGSSKSGSKNKWYMFKIDFDGLHERTCSDKDFEKWAARIDDDGKASCIMGHKQYFQRRKADAECFIDADFKDPQPQFESCVCTEQDFECDTNFVRDAKDRKKCNPVALIKIPEGQCKKDSDTFKSTSGWRLIPGNDCVRKGGVELDKEIDRSCSEATKPPVTGQIEVKKTDFETTQFKEWHYLERSGTSTGDDETIVLRTSKEVLITRDHGKTWKPILKGESITSIAPNPHYHDRLYFLTASKTVHYTIDRGDHFQKFEAQKPPSRISPSVLKFHPDYKDWMLWYGHDGNDNHANVYYTEDRGDDWKTLVRYVTKCEFIPRKDRDKLIFCEQFENEATSNNLQLVSSEDLYAKTTTHFSNILGFAVMSEFIVVAAKLEDNANLKVDASIDGATFADAKFPKDLRVEHQRAYTVLDSSTHAVFLHVTVQYREGHEYGSIVKSNSNGTSYVIMINAVNRDTDGYVDFEKMYGLEGVAMVNIVANAEAADGGEKKKLKSRITHNDGAEWAPMPPPKVDVDGNAFKCAGSDDAGSDKCSLHLHSYTERIDKSATFSSPSALGLMMGVGNVGEYLGRKDDDDTATFISRDAGITWKAVKKGPYMWEYGDQGSIIVIVPESKATRSVFFSLDEGEKWEEYKFSDVDMVVEAITTVPTDNSFNFLLWGKESGARGTISTVNIDFSQLSQRQRQCELDENKPSNGDYELWEPKHPTQDNNCLFGHVAQYHRKRIDADCYNGKKINHLHNIVKNCTCTRQDFECDYNFEVQSENDKTCRLVAGLEPKSHEQFCKDNPDQREYYDVTGYRKIPLSTCEGGQELDKITVLPCPGFEEEFKQKHGLGGAALFFAIVIPIAAASGVGYWVWQQYQKYGFGSFGQIRLGESMGTTGASSRQSAATTLIAIPVAIIAGTWAVAKALPLLASSLFRSARGYMPVGSSSGYSTGPYRSRDAFTNRRQDFSTAAFVEDDELLGDEDELETDEV